MIVQIIGLFSLCISILFIVATVSYIFKNDTFNEENACRILILSALFLIVAAICFK